jgi:hypothetical protein
LDTEREKKEDADGGTCECGVPTLGQFPSSLQASCKRSQGEKTRKKKKSERLDKEQSL